MNRFWLIECLGYWFDDTAEKTLLTSHAYNSAHDHLQIYSLLGELRVTHVIASSSIVSMWYLPQSFSCRMAWKLWITNFLTYRLPLVIQLEQAHITGRDRLSFPTTSSYYSSNEHKIMLVTICIVGTQIKLYPRLCEYTLDVLIVCAHFYICRTCHARTQDVQTGSGVHVRVLAHTTCTRWWSCTACWSSNLLLHQWRDSSSLWQDLDICCCTSSSTTWELRCRMRDSKWKYCSDHRISVDVQPARPSLRVWNIQTNHL